MIIEYTKKLSECSKQDLILLLQGEIDNRGKLLKRIEKAYINQSAMLKDHQSKYDEGFFDGMEAVENIVKNFYHFREDN